jgi:hypothetical protein
MTRQLALFHQTTQVKMVGVALTKRNRVHSYGKVKVHIGSAPNSLLSLRRFRIFESPEYIRWPGRMCRSLVSP